MIIEIEFEVELHSPFFWQGIYSERLHSGQYEHKSWPRPPDPVAAAEPAARPFSLDPTLHVYATYVWTMVLHVYLFVDMWTYINIVCC